jgi:hypothetical protein
LPVNQNRWVPIDRFAWDELMSWLARLSLTQAIHWALVWPALLVTVAVSAISVLIATSGQDDWAFAWSAQSAGPVPAWLAALIIVCGVLVGPSLIFLALWKVARR